MTLYSICEVLGGAGCLFFPRVPNCCYYHSKFPQLTHTQKTGYRELKHNNNRCYLYIFQHAKAALIVTFKQDTVLAVA